ncbi:hypothetical protein M2322_002696 [Rhodoblastus acidophilus]|uniref:phage tail fiber domain-containing protein n=1 Tax=Rhodoblastus acidophilus TaxID=1074 RepID=UPI00222461A7|nr:phage tail fiber protein [Rhodoblastus acidophilus]MCW2317142.1 hypothetical protein [Rhodoblastus acidophilus]
MAYSYNIVQADGSTNVFAVPFNYLTKSDVYVSVNGGQVEGFTWLTDSTIQLPATASSLAGYTIKVYRSTPALAPEVVFTAGGMDPSDLNTQVLQLLYITQEALDAPTQPQAVVVSQLLASLTNLPTTRPPVHGVLWLNGEAICVS